MYKLISSFIIVLFLTSCSKKTTNDFINEAFVNYVKTDFGDPSEFKEITSINPIDTINNNVMLNVINDLGKIEFLFSEKQIDEISEYKCKFSNDETFIVVYEIKVRINKYGRKSIKKYYCIDDGVNYKIQDHQLQMDELPELYKDFYEYSYGLLNEIKR